MNIKEQKKGISLIVLVITIIVMIILAAAIILSLDGSDIIERAKEGQTSNDAATAKELVALAKSEWSFERKEGYDTFREYAESKLEEAGFDMDKTYVEDSGKVLFDAAARFAKAGVEIGTEVTGYTLNSTTTYTTSGKENTYSMEDATEVDNPQPATITRDSGIKWTYIGTDKEGNALIAGSVTADSPKITLGGKGGYLNGPAELDKICDVMYSSSMGTARSMNIDDVIRILEYRGKTSGYYNSIGFYLTNSVKTIGQIAKEIGYDMANFGDATPESGKDIGAYKSDYFYINKTNDAKEYNTARADIIYPASANAKLTIAYWLSSSCVSADFYHDYVEFGVRNVGSGSVNSCVMFYSYDGSNGGDCALRPVVQLTSDIQVTYNGTTAAIN